VEIFKINETDIEEIQKFYGRKTINEIRSEAGLKDVEGGEMAYVDWLKKMAGLPLRPNLRIVQ